MTSNSYFTRHAFELVEFFEYGKLKAAYGPFDMQLFGHLPYAADPARFYPPNEWKDKNVDYLDVDGILDDKAKHNMPLPEDYRNSKLCLFSRRVCFSKHFLEENTD